jgi:hypothetical protein
LLANWPYTIFVIMPTNRHLMNTPAEAATAETRRMLERWGALHAGRSALRLVATLIFLWAPAMSIAGRWTEPGTGISLRMASEILSEIASCFDFSTGVEMKCLEDCGNRPFV